MVLLCNPVHVLGSGPHTCNVLAVHVCPMIMLTGTLSLFTLPCTELQAHKKAFLRLKTEDIARSSVHDS